MGENRLFQAALRLFFGIVIVVAITVISLFGFIVIRDMWRYIVNN